MHRIKQIIGKNIKGLNFTEDLAPATLIAGLNWSGKTSRIKAVSLAVLGYDSARGQTNAKTFMLAGSQKQMSAVVVLDDDQSIGHKWTEKANGSITCEKLGTLQQEIPFVALDAAKYFTLGPKARIDYIFENARADGLTTPRDIIASIVTARHKFSDPAEQTGIDKALEKLREIGQALPIQDWIEKATEVMVAAVKNASDEVDRFKGANQAATQLSSAEAPPRPSPVVDAEISAIRLELTARAVERDQIKAKLARYEDMRTSRIKMTKQLQALPADTVADLDTELKQIQEALAGFDPKGGDDILHSRGKVLGYKEEFTAFNELDYKTLAAKRTEHEELRKATCCPTCKSDNDSWQYVVREKMEHLLHDCDQLDKDINKRNASIKLFDADILALTQKCEAWKIQAQALKPKKARHTLITESLLPKARENKARREALLSYIQAIIDPPSDDDVRVQLHQVSERIDGLILKQDELDIELKEAVAHQQDMIRRMEAIDKQMEAGLALEAIKRVAGIIKAKREALVSQVFDGLMGRINQISGLLLPDTLLYRDGDICKMVGTRLVSQETFTESEKAVTYAAVSVAMATTAPFRLVIIDELGRLDTDNKRKLVAGLMDLIEQGVIDQFIGVDTSSDDYKRFARKDSFKVIELSEQK